MKIYKSLKKTGVAVLCAMLFFSIATCALAAASSATYKGPATLFGFVPDDGSVSGLFNNLQGLMPGGTYTQQITVDNTSGTRVDIYLRGEAFVQAVQTIAPQAMLTSSANDLLDRITFKLKDGSSTIAEGALSSAWPASGSGYNTGSGKFIRLGTFYSGTHKELTLELSVPSDLGNEYQDAVGKVRWVFQADVYQGGGGGGDEYPPIPLGPPTITIDGQRIPLAPGTGDSVNANMYLYAGGLILLALALAVMLSKRQCKTNVKG